MSSQNSTAHAAETAATRSATASRATPAASVRALFHITALADPALVPRLLAPVAKLGHTPTRLYASREDGDGSFVTVDLRLAGVTQVEASRIESALRTALGVTQVIAVYERG